MAAPLERKLRDELLRFSKLCYERHLLVALDGNLSARLSDELVLCTRAGCHKGLLADDDLVVVAGDTRLLEAAAALRLATAATAP